MSTTNLKTIVLPDPTDLLENTREHISKGYNSFFPLHELYDVLTAYQQVRLQVLTLQKLNDEKDETMRKLKNLMETMANPKIFTIGEE